MQVPAEMLKEDRDRQFADWGQDAIFREVTQSYDPQTQQVVETLVDTNLQVIVGEGSFKPTVEAGAQHLTERISFLIKTEAFPTATPTTTSRIVYLGVEYDILKYFKTIHDVVYTLECRKTV